MAGGEWTGPGAGDRVLVIAPHPDDESLALGGLIHRSRRLGADVRVVFLTSGDGFRVCAALRYLRPPNSRIMRRLAKERVGEARAALSYLGVPPSEALFLGYPDRGLAELWLHAWRPAETLRSSGAALEEVPAAHFRPGAPFCGVSVVEDLTHILGDFAPTHVFHPSTADDHPDHWAGGCFAIFGLEQVRYGGQVRSYPVHRGGWPQPWRAAPNLPLTPPAELKALPFTWEACSLEAQDLEAKSAALQAHATQQPLMGHFLQAFIRRNELLYEQTQSPDQTCFPDPVRDRWLRARWPAADFTSLEWDPEAGSLTAHLRGAPSSALTYTLSWKPLSGSPDGAFTRHCRFQKLVASGDGGAVHGRALRAHSSQRRTHLLIGAAIHLNGLQLDRTPWFKVCVPAEHTPP
jgi:LmbE family N-acetylglucosaminyl deacetylase